MTTQKGLKSYVKTQKKAKPNKVRIKLYFTRLTVKQNYTIRSKGLEPSKVVLYWYYANILIDFNTLQNAILKKMKINNCIMLYAYTTRRNAMRDRS